MKSITVLFFALAFSLITRAQAIPDSVTKAFAESWCNCMDTLDFSKPKDQVKKSVNFCRTLAMTDLLNKGLLTPEIISNEAQFKDIQNKALEYMVQHCEVLKAAINEQAKEPPYSKDNPSNLFIPVAFFKPYKLIPGEVNNFLHVYNMEGKEGRYQRMVDIRWVFHNNADALKWHRIKLEANSEGGTEVKGAFVLPGAEEVHVYRESPEMAETIKGFGIKQRQHYCIFVVGNVVCKVFLATDESIDSKAILPFANAAAIQVKANPPKW
jgi:hypothetical protein